MSEETSELTSKNKERVILSDFRCMKCSKLLAKLKGIAEIKCPRCKSFNYFSE